MTGYEVVLLRHGETVGYDDDLGLSGRGRLQAFTRGHALARELYERPEVVLVHARSARATATAAMLHEQLVEGEVAVGAPTPDPCFDNLRTCVDGEVIDTNVATARRLSRPDAHPDWARELDRFRTEDHDVAAPGAPITFWVSTPTLFFEPPALAAFRLWRGVQEWRAPDRVAVIVTHSAPMRALLNTVLGHDPGEPHHLEPIRIHIGDDPAEGAEIRYRNSTTYYAGPPSPPPWFDAEFVAGRG